MTISTRLKKKFMQTAFKLELQQAQFHRRNHSLIIHNKLNQLHVLKPIDPIMGDMKYLDEQLMSTNLENTGSDEVRKTFVYSSVNLDRGISNWATSIVGKLLSSEHMHPDTLQSHLKNIWVKKVKKVQIRNPAPNLFIVRLTNWDQVNWVLENAPWSVNGFLFIVKRYNSFVKIQNMDFSIQEFWVDFKDLPPELFDRETMFKFAKILGEVEKIEPEDGNPIDTNAVSAYIKINVKTPLIRGLLTENGAGYTQWIPFFYQKHPGNLCPACFVLDHDEDDCENKAKFVRALANKELFKFGQTNYSLEDVIAINPKYGDGSPIKINKKVSKKKSAAANKVVFQRPSDGYHVSPYTEEARSNSNAGEGSSMRRNKREREKMLPETSTSTMLSTWKKAVWLTIVFTNRLKKYKTMTTTMGMTGTITAMQLCTLAIQGTKIRFISYHSLKIFRKSIKLP